jgi:phage terminase large subunit-like protein
MSAAHPIPVESVEEELAALEREAESRALAEYRDALREHALRYDAPGAFASFVDLMWPVVEPRTLEWAPYMDAVCHALHRQMLGDPGYQRLLINLPPGYAKSLLVSVLAPAYEWTFAPSRRKLFFTSDDDLSARDSRRTRILITSDSYRAFLGEACRRRGVEPWKLAFDQNEKRNFENSERGFRQCLTLKTGVTGKRGDDLVVDDPIDVKAILLGGPEAANTRCAEAGAIIDQALETRVNDRRDARRTIVMQRLHPDDPAGRAIAEGGWKVLCLPLHFDPEKACPEDPRTIPGELLHPRDTEEDAQRLAAKLGWTAAGQLEQRPLAAEALQIRPEWLTRTYTCEPEAVAHRAIEVWISSDPNQKGGAGRCDAPCHVWARCDDGYHILDRVARPMSYPEYERVMDDLITRWAAWLAQKGGALIEDTANGATYLQVRGPIYKGVTLHAFLPSADTPGTDKSKAARAAYTIRAASAMALVFPAAGVAPWAPTLRERLLGWPAVGKDDMDAMSQLHMRWAVQESNGPSFFDLFAAG